MTLKSSTRIKAVILAAAILTPLIDSNQYRIDVLTMAGIYAILAIGLNIVIGYTGLLHLGHAAFYAIGAYSYALLNRYAELGFWEALPLCAAITGIAGVLIGFPSLRLRGDYLAIVTLGAGEIVRICLRNLSITGGPNGIDGISHPTVPFISSSGISMYDFGLKSWPYYYLVLFILLILIVCSRRMETSRIGRAWAAIREDEVAAEAMGIDTAKMKLAAFGIGAVCAGIAGCIFAAKQGAISPDSFGFITSVSVVSMVVLGGLGNVYGVILGAVILTLLPEALRELPAGFTTYRMLVFGMALILMMLLRPQGILGTRKRKLELKEDHIETS